MEKEIEFESQISKKGKEGYYIKIPSSLKRVVEPFHGKKVLVKIRIEEE